MSAQDPLEALIELLSLDDIPRMGWIQRGVTPPESVAGHIVGVSHLALALVPRIQPELDLGRVLAMAVLHDAPEARTGDLPRRASIHLPPGAKRTMEDGAAGELLEGLGETALDAWNELRAAETREARFVKVCDALQLGVRLLGYVRTGRRGLGEFRSGLEELDASEFPPAEALRVAILAGLDAEGGA